MKKFTTLLLVGLFATAPLSRSFAQSLLQVYDLGNKTVLMNFTVGCALNEVTYELQRSGDGFNFTTFYTATVTQSQCSTPFTYTDANPVKGISYYRYRLTNYNGFSGFSNISAVKLAGNEKIKVVPTLAVNSVSVFYTATKPGSSGWALYDMEGHLMMKQELQLRKGQNEIRFDISSLNHGHYQVRGITPEEKTDAIAIIKE